MSPRYNGRRNGLAHRDNIALSAKFPASFPPEFISVANIAVSSLAKIHRRDLRAATLFPQTIGYFIARRFTPVSQRSRASLIARYGGM